MPFGAAARLTVRALLPCCLLLLLARTAAAPDACSDAFAPEMDAPAYLDPADDAAGQPEALVERLFPKEEDAARADELRRRLAGAGGDDVRMWALMADQALGGIDYERAGCGWNHPESRGAYRARTHASFGQPVTRSRRARDRDAIEARLLEALADGGGSLAESAAGMFAELTGARALGADPPTVDGVRAALDGEALVPLRAHCECVANRVTMSGEPVPADAYAAAVRALAAAVGRGVGAWAEARYGGPPAQLAGLPSPVESWSFDGRPASYADGAWTAWDGAGPAMHRAVLALARKLGAPVAVLADTYELLWATKVGGPSHGFDYEPQCHLPLLLNGRHKAILVFDPSFEGAPAFRAHVRLLRTEHGDWHVYLEPLNACFTASLGAARHDAATRAYVGLGIALARRLGASLSFEPGYRGVVSDVSDEGLAKKARFSMASVRYVLEPSTAVCEASDTLSNRHDWVQTEREVTGGLRRGVLEL